MNIFNENKGTIASVIGAIIVIALVINGLPKQSEGEKQAQTNAQEIIKLVNTQNNFNNQIIIEQKNIKTQSGIIANAGKSISGSLEKIEEISNLIVATNDRLKKYNLKYGQ